MGVSLRVKIDRWNMPWDPWAGALAAYLWALRGSRVLLWESSVLLCVSLWKRFYFWNASRVFEYNGLCTACLVCTLWSSLSPFSLNSILSSSLSINFLLTLGIKYMCFWCCGALCRQRGIALPIHHHYEWCSLKQTQVRDRYFKSRFVSIPSQHWAKRKRTLRL